MAEQEQDLELDESSEDFDIEENEDGSATLIPKEKETPDEPEFYGNLAESDIVSSFKLNELSTDLLRDIETDKKSRELREKQYAETIQRTGLGDDAPGGAEFEGASKVVHPLISEAVVDFASAAIKELFPSNGPVKTKLEGKPDAEKYRKADRKQRHMNWQARKQIPEFKPVIEQILTQIPLGGVQYTKMYYWSRGKRPKIEFVPLDDIYIPYHAASFYSAQRKTHRQRLTQIEFEERIASGLYRDIENIVSEGDSNLEEQSKPKRANDKIEGKEMQQYDDDGLRTIYECYCWLDLDDPEVAGDYNYAPYIVSIDDSSQEVLSIYRNWDSEEQTYEELQWITEWSFIPWRGAYAIGLGHLIGGLSAAATGALRALLDSAHINNSPTALKLKGAQMSGQSASITIGNIHEIDAAPGVDDIRKIAMPLPFNPPSSVLFELLGFLTNAAKGIVRTAIEQNPDYSPNTAPGTEFSHIEQGLKVYSAIHSRLHDAMGRQLCILHRLNKDYMEDVPAPDYGQMDDWVDEEDNTLAYKSDYEGEMDVEPVSDPNIFSEAQRFSQMSSVLQLSTTAPPGTYDLRAVHKRMLQLMKVPNYEEFLPEPDKMKDENPATENIKMASGAHAGVMPDQDHLAHIQTHMDFMSSPMFGQNPAIKPVFAASWLNHMIQHILMLYGSEMRETIEEAAGTKAKDFMSDNPKVTEALAKAIAAASPMVMKQTEGLVSKLMPMIEQTMQYVQSLQAPPPMDPAAASLQVAQMGIQQKDKEITVNAQLKDKEIATNAQLKQAELQTTAMTDAERIKFEEGRAQIEASNKIILKDKDIQSKERIAEINSQTNLTKNQEDNDTAMKITAMRISTGKAAGNFSNGASLDNPSYAQGGLVEMASSSDQQNSDPFEDYINRIKEASQVTPPSINVDTAPIAELLKSMPQQDLTPIIEAIKNQKPTMNYVDNSRIADEIKSLAENMKATDVSPLIEEFRNHAEKVHSAVSSIGDLHNDVAENLKEAISESIEKGHDRLEKALKKRPKLSFEIARDKDKKMSGVKVVEEKEDGN